MKTIDIQEAAKLVQQGTQITHGERMRLVNERLHALVDYARQNSPWLAERYRNLPRDYTLADIPVTEKSEMIAHFDDYVTDREIRLHDVEAYIERDLTDTRLYLDRYTVLHTSGTTGTPLYMVRDQHRNRIHGMLTALRLLGDLDPELGDIQKHKQAAIIHVSAGTSSYEACRRDLAEPEQSEGRLLVLPVLEDPEVIVEKLNAFQPEVLSAYASVLTILALEAEKGRLHIPLKAIATSAEMLTPENDRLIRRVFQCPVKNNYCMTEGGEIAMNREGPELLLNEDFVIIEPVDENRNPVRNPDEWSQGILVTDLTNYVQPVIRYYVNDRVRIERISDDTVRLPVLQINGRANDVFTVCGKSFSTMALDSLIDMDPGLLDDQFVQVGDDELQLRVLTAGNVNRAEALPDMARRLQEYLKARGCSAVKVGWSDEYPIRKARGGKAPKYIDLRK